LGSLLAVTNATGAVVMEQNFDAWGRNRNTTDWTYNNIAAPTLAWQTRGYTGHEHLPVFGLINMNGRLYDPLLGRMLSPDNYTHGGSQGYNRYTYAMNNPLKYTDPDGQNPAVPVIAFVGGALNVWSNWSNIVDGNIGQSLARGAAYFLSGAVGSVVGITNPYLGSNITAIGNAGIALASGKLPQIKNFRDLATYAGTELVKATASTFLGQAIGKKLMDIAQNWKWFERGFTIAGGGLSAAEIKELGSSLQPSIILGDATGVAARKGIDDFVGVTISKSAMALIKGGSSTFEDVARHISTNGNLSADYITKTQAKALGWKSTLGNLHTVAPGKSIGGDIFNNKEGLLPAAIGRTWFEADINYLTGFRGNERLLYSSDGLFYQTLDHYLNFSQIFP
jgi:RHS repeat-associated protein